MVGGKKRRKGGGRERSEKDTSALFFLHSSSFQPRYPIKILSITYIVS
ncbi:hypothetical protein [Aneurinibacillus migulanus]|nr:hypothetical protein [Aneurinibacillus migulanus]